MLLVGGCAAPEAGAGAQTQAGLTAPAKLPVEALHIDTRHGPIRFTVEVAADEGSREYGLMYRRAMADSHGMIFDFRTPQATSFWMENTFIPLDMLFVAADGRIVNIAANAKPHDRTPVPSAGPIRAVIEINGGLAEKLGIRAGDRVRDARVFGNG